MAEMIETAVREANAQIVTERGFKLVREPQVTLPEEQGAVEQVIEGKSDLAYTVAIEILPTIELADFKGIQLERLNAEVTDAEVEEALTKIAEQSRPFAPKGEGAKAENGDRVTIDFTGKIDGVPFEGGTGGDFPLHLGSGSFIPGFEDQLIGIAAGEKRTVNVTFPQIYPTAHLAGKNAEFDVTVKAVESPQAVTLNDEFAKSLGLELLAKLREMVKERLDREHGAMSRQKVKRKLLDELDAKHKFTPPPSLVEDEFNNVWKTISTTCRRRKRTFEEEDTTEEKAKEEYRGIAERRVRLGLVIAEIGERNSIKVSDEELSRAVMDRARQVPGPRAGGVGFLPQQPRCAGEPARADLRGQGDRFHPRARQDHRQDGFARGALQGRRGLTAAAACAVDASLVPGSRSLSDGPADARRNRRAQSGRRLPDAGLVLRAREPI